MIKSFKHKGLKKLIFNNNLIGINSKHGPRLTRILERLDASVNTQDMNLPGYKLHELSDKSKRTWSVRVSGNWRVIFQFEGTDTIVVDYQDYIQD